MSINEFIFSLKIASWVRLESLKTESTSETNLLSKEINLSLIAGCLYEQPVIKKEITIVNKYLMCVCQGLHTTVRLGDVSVFENRQPVTTAKFINKSLLFILLLGVISQLELKSNSEQNSREYIRRRAILLNRLLDAVTLLVSRFYLLVLSEQ